MTQRIPVNEPWISDAAKHWVAEVVESGFVSSAGPMVAKFESAFAGFLGVEHALATNSGTSALHLALLALGVGPGDEVIVPDFTMIATVNAVLYCGATPVFVDVEPDTFTLDPRMVEGVITLRTRAIVVVHVYGHSADMDPIMAMARGHGLSVVEDAAEAHGARYRGRLCGGLADIAAFSFYGNKLITTGEGGMVVTQDARLADRVRSLRDMAHDPAKRFRHLELGFSYRMGSLQAFQHIHHQRHGLVGSAPSLLRRVSATASQYPCRTCRRMRRDPIASRRPGVCGASTTVTLTVRTTFGRWVVFGTSRPSKSANGTSLRLPKRPIQPSTPLCDFLTSCAGSSNPISSARAGSMKPWRASRKATTTQIGYA